MQKVTGETRFANDLLLPWVTYGKLLHSVYPHAWIVLGAIASHPFEAADGEEILVGQKLTPDVNEGEFLVEVIDPRTREPADEGELVLTDLDYPVFLSPAAMPLIVTLITSRSASASSPF